MQHARVQTQAFDTVGISVFTSSAAGVDLLVLRELMGHVSPETTAGYVHLSAANIAAEYATARAKVAQ